MLFLISNFSLFALTTFINSYFGYAIENRLPHCLLLAVNDLFSRFGL